jgi:hypothetical protein
MVHKEVKEPYQVIYDLRIRSGWRMHDFSAGHGEVWSMTTAVTYILRVSTLVTTVGFIAFIQASRNLLPDRTPSISEAMYLRASYNVAFAFMLVVHTYGMHAYLILMSGYNNGNTTKLLLLCLSTYFYIIAVFILTYVHMDTNVEQHEVLAQFAFVGATISSALHCHNTKLLEDITENQRLTVFSVEISLIIILFSSMVAFFITGSAAAEYIFVFAVLWDKQVKISTLEHFKVRHINGILRQSYVLTP